MDYLDPDKKKAHKRRLYVGYGLMAILIALMTTILVYLGSGFYLDRQTGGLIQNGQLFIAGKPEDAQIYLNDKLQKTKTAGKLIVPSGSYKVDIKKEGYRDWSQQVQLEGGKITRLDYIRMLPVDMKTTTVQTFADAPTQVMQSKDRRFMALTFADTPTTVYVYDLISPEVAPVPVTLPDSIFRNSNNKGTVRIAEWASDNRHILLEHTLPDASLEHIIIGREQTDAMINISRQLGLTTEAVQLAGGAKDTVFIYNAQNQNLYTAKTNESTPTLRLSNISQFKAYDSETIVYITPSLDPTKIQARITEGASTYLLREYAAGGTYLLGASKDGSAPVVLLGSVAENKVTVLRNPIGYLKADTSRSIPLATTIFLLESPSEIAFSTDGSVAMARGGDKVATHYFQEDKTTRFTLPEELKSSALTWIESKQLRAVTADTTYVLDFDGTNVQKIGTSNGMFGAFYDNNYRSIYTFSTAVKPFNINRSVTEVTN